MTNRVISTLRHPYTGRQILARMLRLWSQNRYRPVIFIARPGEVDKLVRSARVALSRERARQGTPKGTHYGFTASEIFPYTENGITGEAIVIRWHMTALQNLRNTADSDLIKELTNV